MIIDFMVIGGPQAISISLRYQAGMATESHTINLESLSADFSVSVFLLYFLYVTSKRIRIQDNIRKIATSFSS